MSYVTWGEVARSASNAGAKYPELVAAQWALESGWGTALSGKNNPFGIKGKGTKVKTTEFVNGKQIEIVDEFMDFVSIDDAIKWLVDRWYKDFKDYKGVNNAVTSTVLVPTDVSSDIPPSVCNNVTGVWSSAENKAIIFFDQIQTSGSFTATAAIYFNTMTIGGVAGTTKRFVGSVNLSSKAFMVSGIPHVVGSYSLASLNGATYTSIQPTNFLFNLYNLTSKMDGISAFSDVIANIAGKFSPGAAKPIAPEKSYLTCVRNYAGKYELATLQNSNFTLEVTPYDPSFAPVGVINCIFDFILLE